MRTSSPRVLCALLCAPLLCASVAHAQSHFTVPAGFDGQDGAGLMMLPGAGGNACVQIVLGRSLMTGAQGRRLAGMTLRRDGGRFPLGAGQIRLRLTLAEVTGLDPLRASETFAANLGAQSVVVFDGSVDLPASPKPPQRQAAAWSAPYAITLPFASALHYSGNGALCVQIEGQVGALPVSFWPIDVETSGFAGQVSHVGRACGAVAARVQHPGDVSDRWMRPGSTVRFLNLAPAGSASVMLLANSIFPQGFDLTPFGSPGCELWLDPAITIASVTRSVSGTHVPAAASTYLRLPSDSGVLGAMIAAQWLNVEGASLTTTNAVQARVAFQMPWLDAAVVATAITDGPPAPTGRVHTGRAAVVRFELQ